MQLDVNLVARFFLAVRSGHNESRSLRGVFFFFTACFAKFVCLSILGVL